MRYLEPITAVLLFAGAAFAQQLVPVMVKTNVRLDAAVQAAMAGYATHVTEVWPQINAMAMEVRDTALAGLRADPRVALVEVDEEIALPAAVARETNSASAAPVFLPWNQDQVDTLDSGLDGTGVTVVPAQRSS